MRDSSELGSRVQPARTPGRGRVRGLAAWVSSTALAATGCSQIRSSSEVSIVPRSGVVPKAIGPQSGEIDSRTLEATWSQDLDTLAVTLLESRTCRRLVHEPVVRVEKITRRPDGGIYWEYGLGAVLTSLGIVGLARPEALSSQGTSSDGQVMPDLRTGLRLGAVFASIGVLLLAGGIYDTIRARDEIHYAEAYRLGHGEVVPCDEPLATFGDRELELIAGTWRRTGRTDPAGKVVFVLPPEDEALALAERTDVAPREFGTLRKAVLKVPGRRAVIIDFVAPYASTRSEPHEGRHRLEAP